MVCCKLMGLLDHAAMHIFVKLLPKYFAILFMHFAKIKGTRDGTVLLDCERQTQLLFFALKQPICQKILICYLLFSNKQNNGMPSIPCNGISEIRTIVF